jgi:ribosomal protein S18 acetylase RimI-like enzyme
MSGLTASIRLLMIRPTTPEDTTALIALADATGLFPPSGLELLRQMLTDSLAENSNTESFWITDDDTEPVGVAYCESERMTDRTWNLQLIAIHPNRQGQGRGTKLLTYIEQALLARGGRMLLVETSGSPDFEHTRAFYRKCGYEKEARIRDFYATGDDKVVFRKVLNAN